MSATFDLQHFRKYAVVKCSECPRLTSIPWRHLEHFRHLALCPVCVEQKKIAAAERFHTWLKDLQESFKVTVITAPERIEPIEPKEGENIYDARSEFLR